MSSPMTSEVFDDGSLATVIQKYEAYKIYDAHKAEFFDEIVQRLQFLSNQLAAERAEIDRDRKMMQRKLVSIGENGNHMMGSCPDPYVVVLIDGNDLVFRDILLSQGDIGGRLAAQFLYQAINEFTFSTIGNLPDNTKVVVRIYVDLEDLTSICLRAGIVDNSNKIKTFVRGFCQDRALFDLIDVGMQGQAVIFDKMEETLKMYAYDSHCKHILFGCEDGEVYARMLRVYGDDFEIKHRITLLHGTPLDRHLENLHLGKTQMIGVFRSTKVVYSSTEANSLAVLPLDAVTPPLSTPATSRSNSRTAIEAAHSGVVGHSRQISLSSSVNSAASAALVKPKVSSWAMAAKMGAAVKTTPSNITEAPGSSIRRNIRGQRIDPPTPEFKKDEVNRLKKLKLCNAHHLRQDCPYSDGKCTHDHMYKPTKQERETLKLVARMSACIHGSECDDPKCIYGHRCPFPEVREDSKKGKACINGDNCRFPAHMHGMDTQPVRVVKIT